MQTKQHRTSRLGRIMVPVAAISVLAYFAMHAQSGKYGLESKRVLAEELGASRARHAKLVTERETLEKQVRLLQDGTLERDMIDEQARRSLNMTGADELTILNEDGN